MLADQLARSIQDVLHDRVPTDPYLTSHVLLGNVEESAFFDDVAIASHFASHFASPFQVAGKQSRRKRPQRGLLIGKEMPLESLLGGSTYPLFGNI